VIAELRTVSVGLHPTAVIEPGAVLAESVSIGPFCYVGANVRIGPRSTLLAHATVLGPTCIGSDNIVFPQAVLGCPAQDRSYQGEATELRIGDKNIFREGASVHRGTIKGGGCTCIGSGCLIMANAHVAHDCLLEDHVVLTTGTVLGGHVHVGSLVTCGGLVAVAPFARLGRLSYIAGGARVERDVPPFVIASGDRARVRAINRVGLRRAGVPEESQCALKKAFRHLFLGHESLAVALDTLPSVLAGDVYVAELAAHLGERRSRS
jgi:UDP-N-acetylglucosamine acyltransferase